MLHHKPLSVEYTRAAQLPLGCTVCSLAEWHKVTSLFADAHAASHQQFPGLHPSEEDSDPHTTLFTHGWCVARHTCGRQ